MFLDHPFLSYLSSRPLKHKKTTMDEREAMISLNRLEDTLRVFSRKILDYEAQLSRRDIQPPSFPYSTLPEGLFSSHFCQIMVVLVQPLNEVLVDDQQAAATIEVPVDDQQVNEQVGEQHVGEQQAVSESKDESEPEQPLTSLGKRRSKRKRNAKPSLR